MRDQALQDLVSKVIDDMTHKRKALGLSHQRLADSANIDRSAISLIESKKRSPSLLTVLKLCNALGISLADLLKNHESQP